MGCTSPFSSGPYLKQKHQKYRHNLHKGVFALIALFSNSQISFQKSISLPNLLSIAAQRRCIEQELNYPLIKNCWSRGVGNKTDPIDYIEHPVPLITGGDFNENQKIESNYLGIEFRAGDQETIPSGVSSGLCVPVAFH